VEASSPWRSVSGSSCALACGSHGQAATTSPITPSSCVAQGLRFTVVGAVAAAVVVVGTVGIIPAFPGGHRWPFLVLVFPSAVFLYGGVRAVRAARKSSSPRA
jgi:hypothetical protein